MEGRGETREYAEGKETSSGTGSVTGDPEPKLEYLPKSKAIEFGMPLRVCIEKSEIDKKIDWIRI